MSEAKTNLKAGGAHGAFRVLSVFPVADYHATGIHLRHESGLEVFHLLNGDEENLFAFAFRTLNPRADGAAHILEHSVLCGSERYPLKDPFIRLSGQSVKTYLNAMTYPDRTVFPASSLVRADYFNLMDVYGDAVFFPRLDPEVFMQEAHRLEVDENGVPSVQGVVYNEMKGNYSSFEGVAADAAANSLLKGCVYAQDSGGDPLAIPSLTHGELVAFHERWYRPDNCLVFLYGNIPTEEQLDFLQAHFLDRLAARFPERTTEEARSARIASFVRAVTPEPVTEPRTVYAEGPAGEEGAGRRTVLVNWLFGTCPDAETSYAYQVLAGILLNHDGSPLQKALLESGLGEDIAPQTGLDGSLYQYMLSVGLRGVKKGDERRVERVIFDTLAALAEHGIAQGDIDATLMSMEYAQCEIKRVHGPYSLRLMSRPIYAWLYGHDLRQSFRLRATFDRIAEHIRAQDGYLERLIRELLLENKRRSLVVVTPTKAYTRRREKAERNLIAALMKKTSIAAVRAENAALHAFQSREEDDSCLPHLKPADFLRDAAPLVDTIATDIDSIPGTDGKPLPLFVNREHTNGIVYVDVGFPTDVLAAADYPLLPLLAESVSEVGWGGMDWAQAAAQAALHTGGISVSLLVSDTGDSPNTKQIAARSKEWVSREWLVFRVGMLEKECEAALGLLAGCIAETDFRDTKRLQDICNELRNDIDATVIPDGHEYVSLRTKRAVSRTKAVDELWNGLSLLFTLHNLPKDGAGETAERLRALFSAVKAGGAFVHVTAEESGIARVKGLLADFVRRADVRSLKPPAAARAEDFVALTDLGADGAGETFAVSAQVGFAAQCTPCSPYGTKEAALEEVCAHWLSNTLLWEKLRTIGGAYGAFCYTEPLSRSLVFSTYRDPTPHKSADVFNACLAECAQREMSAEDAERAVVGTYSGNIQPRSPHGRGATGLLRTLYAVSDDDREAKVRAMLSATPQDLREAFARLAAFAAERTARAIMCGNISNGTGKSIRLPV